MIWLNKEVTITTHQIDGAISFYQEAIGLWRCADTDKVSLRGDTGHQLILVRGEPTESQSISMMADDLEHFIDSLRTWGVDVTTNPTRQPDGSLLATLRDPDSNDISVVQSPGTTI